MLVWHNKVWDRGNFYLSGTSWYMARWEGMATAFILAPPAGNTVTYFYPPRSSWRRIPPAVHRAIRFRFPRYGFARGVGCGRLAVSFLRLLVSRLSPNPGGSIFGRLPPNPMGRRFFFKCWMCRFSVGCFVKVGTNPTYWPPWICAELIKPLRYVQLVGGCLVVYVTWA